MQLSDYYQPAYIDQETLLGMDCRVYCIDGHPHGRGGDYDMARHVGLPSCHCCDYFIFEQDAISLIEITEILITKKNMKERCPYIPEKEADKFFIDYVIKENTLKMYGSMAILCWFANDCQTMASNLYKRKKYKYWLVICGHKKDSKGLEKIKISLEREMKSRLKGVASNFLAEMSVLFSESLEEKIKDCAIAV